MSNNTENKNILQPYNGDRFNKGKLDHTLIPIEALEELSRILEYGKEKYAAWNWVGLEVEECLPSAFRHLTKLVQGEWIDEESGLSHAGHVMANMSFLIYLHSLKPDEPLSSQHKMWLETQHKFRTKDDN